MRPDPKRLELVVLARLAARTKNPTTKSDLKRAIRPFVEHALGASEAAELLERALFSLEAEGAITARPLALTDRGEERLTRFLGIEKLPQKIAWASMKRTYLTARALDLNADAKEVRERIKDADGLRGTILRRRHDLPGRPTPTLARAIDALVWRQIGVETDQPLTLNELRAHLLRKLLGTSARIGLDKVKRVLAAEAAGATSPDADALRLALMRRWLCEEESAAAGFDLDRFAGEVRTAAARLEDGRFGDDRVFIAAVWRSLGSELSLDEFKDRLVEANRAGLLRLTRADLVESMDPDEVSLSATHYLNATFHFVEADARGAS